MRKARLSPGLFFCLIPFGSETFQQLLQLASLLEELVEEDVSLSHIAHFLKGGSDFLFDWGEFHPFILSMNLLCIRLQSACEMMPTCGTTFAKTIDEPSETSTNL